MSRPWPGVTANTEGLSDAEREAQSWLLDQYQRRMLLRATAANLLKDRGHDISRYCSADELGLRPRRAPGTRQA